LKDILLSFSILLYMICVVINLTNRGFVLICILYLKHFYRAVSLQVVTTETAVVFLGKGITTWSPFCCCAAHETNTVIQSTGIFFFTCPTLLFMSCQWPVVTCHVRWTVSKKILFYSVDIFEIYECINPTRYGPAVRSTKTQACLKTRVYLNAANRLALSHHLEILL